MFMFLLNLTSEIVVACNQSHLAIVVWFRDGKAHTHTYGKGVGVSVRMVSGDAWSAGGGGVGGGEG